MKRVVVTGLGVLAPNGSNIHSFKTSLENGISGIKHHEFLKQTGMQCQIGGIPDYDENFLAEHVPSKKLKYVDCLHIKYACTAAIEAWLDAGLGINENNLDWNTGCIFGGSVSDLVRLKEIINITDSKEHKRLGLRNIEQIMISGVSAYISGLLGIANQVSSISSACATGTESILMAFERIQMGKATRMLAGSFEIPSVYVWANFDNMRLLPRKYNHDPIKASRPLSNSAAGFVPGSGSGALVLEELDTALARGARIYAEILGGSSNSGGQRNGGSMTAPNKEGVIKCIKDAIDNSKLDPDSIDLICGHLTATQADKIEISNWASALHRKGSAFPYINSLKSMIGHCLSAAGSIETVGAVLQLYYQFIHPSLNCEDTHPEILATIDKKCIPSNNQKKKIEKIIKANFGFGDVNASIILSKF